MTRSAKTKREYLRQLVNGKNQSFRPLMDEERELGFLGWHERGYLPHCDYPGLIQFITFRLDDSMPTSRRGEWEHLLAIEDAQEKRIKLEAYLDIGVGECHLREPRIAKIVADSLLAFHNERYELLAWCIMPNHVHVLVHIWQMPLGEIIQSWKRFSATKALRLIRSEWRSLKTDAAKRRSSLRSFWEREYWDTFMRDEAQEGRAVRYIENNPVKARLCRSTRDWLHSSAQFRGPETSQLRLWGPQTALRRK